jgi:asparagine synthase (glutamine-hydrolysing)
MCGVCGVFSYAGPERVTEDVIITMRDTMIHRGPDDKGAFVSLDGQIGLGHRRLSIIDLSEAGRQPLSNEDETVWTTYNGEIYNYQELTSELKAKGHRFSSRTDTEVIVHLYEEYGKDLVNRIRGEFAFAVWDSEKKSKQSLRIRL